jgi:hypothetical protein
MSRVMRRNPDDQNLLVADSYIRNSMPRTNTKPGGLRSNPFICNSLLFLLSTRDGTSPRNLYASHDNLMKP